MSKEDERHSNRLFCDAWDGSRSLGFLQFKRNFKTGMSAHFNTEDDYSLWQACMDTDQGGGAAGADPMPAQGQNGHANAVRRRKRRHAKAFERIFAHMDNERIKEMLDALPDNGDRGHTAWQLVLRECDQGTTDLEILDTKAEFEKCDIEKSVGYSADTITAFARELNAINTRLPVGPPNRRYDDDALSIKLLSSILHPESLAYEAVLSSSKPLLPTASSCTRSL